MRRRPGTIVAVVLVLVAIGALLALRRSAVHDLRSLEASYIAAREPTACATAMLAPSAFTPDVERLPDTVLQLVTGALAETRALRDEYGATSHVRTGLPVLRRADRAMARALDAQVALYEEMVTAPEDSDPELRALGHANADVERQLRQARRQLLSGEADGWERRFVCDR